MKAPQARFKSNIRQIVNKYCGSLFVGHCTIEQLFEHFLDFSKEMDWDGLGQEVSL